MEALARCFTPLCMLCAFKRFEANAMTLVLTCNHWLTLLIFRLNFFFSSSAYVAKSERKKRKTKMSMILFAVVAADAKNAFYFSDYRARMLLHRILSDQTNRIFFVYWIFLFSDSATRFFYFNFGGPTDFAQQQIHFYLFFSSSSLELGTLATTGHSKRTNERGRIRKKT